MMHYVSSVKTFLAAFNSATAIGEYMYKYKGFPRKVVTAVIFHVSGLSLSQTERGT